MKIKLIRDDDTKSIQFIFEPETYSESLQLVELSTICKEKKITYYNSLRENADYLQIYFNQN